MDGIAVVIFAFWQSNGNIPVMVRKRLPFHNGLGTWEEMGEQCQEQGTIDKGWKQSMSIWEQLPASEIKYILARANHNEGMYILSWSPSNAIKECRLLESTSCSCMKMKDFDSHIVMKGKGYQSKDIHPLQHFKLKACVTILSWFMLLHHAIIHWCCSLIKRTFYKS